MSNEGTTPTDLSEKEVVIAGKTYLTLPGLADTLRVSPRTIARWDAARIGPPRIQVGRLILYAADTVDSWLEAQQRPSPARRRGKAA